MTALAGVCVPWRLQYGIPQEDPFALWFLVQPLECISGGWRQGDKSTYSPGRIRLTV